MTLEEAIMHYYEVLDRTEWLEELKKNREKLNHQKAEIKKLKLELEGVKEANHILRNNNKIAINNAIKEFARELKKKQQTKYISYKEINYAINYVETKYIDKLLEKMEGETE